VFAQVPDPHTAVALACRQSVQVVALTVQWATSPSVKHGVTLVWQECVPVLHCVLHVPWVVHTAVVPAAADGQHIDGHCSPLHTHILDALHV
jgi:hypothetical protein